MRDQPAGSPAGEETRRFAACASGLASGLTLAVRPAGAVEAPRARAGPEDPKGERSCTGAANQKWDTRNWRIHYDNPAAVNAAVSKVLDDTGHGGNGTQQANLDQHRRHQPDLGHILTLKV
ncbi:MAG TPA: hypothetical protein VG142_03425 [Trebonia sp.]|nr:hypothetical protein [Trebonia sp.]